LDAKYKKVSISEVVKQCTHLSTTQKEDLCQVLKGFPKLFNGMLGVCRHMKFHIDIMPDMKPKHARPYAIARINLKAFKKKLDHLVSIGLRSTTGASKWGSPTLIMPKKDRQVH
jgi:hypothetical protein